jgi:hypothetical protein
LPDLARFIRSSDREIHVVLNRFATLVAGLAMAIAAPALAQTAPGSTSGSGASPAGASAPSSSDLSDRVNDNRRVQRGASSRRQQQRPPSPEQIKAGAVALAAQLKPSCQVVDATLRGNSAQGQTIYEASCATGPGYILITAVEARGDVPAVAASAADCVDLFGQADVARQRDPAVDVGLQCEIPANQDVLKVVSGYARSAGVACTVDQGSATGVRNGQTVYEVGCPGADGYWVERAGEGWSATPCIQIKSMNGACRYTTAAEQAATLKGWLVGSEAASCDVTEARYMGANANGAFFEAKCAGADGVIARLSNERAVQQVYPCASAQRIGGGCTLTPAAAAPAPAPASRR